MSVAALSRLAARRAPSSMALRLFSAAAPTSTRRTGAGASGARGRGRKGNTPRGSKPSGDAATTTRASEGSTLSDVLALARNDDDINKIIDSVDATQQETAEAASSLPVTVSGPQAEYAQIAYERAMQLNKSNPISGLEKITQQLEGVSNVVSKADYAIHRFFTEPDYLPKETIQALNLLMTEDVPLKKLDAIKDDELREYFIADEEGLRLWNEARSAIKNLKLSKQTTDVLQCMADAGDLHLLSPTLESLHEILLSASTTARINIESAVELTAAQKKDVQAALGKWMPEGKKDMDVEFTVDPSVVGGLNVNIDDITIDLSSASLVMALGKVAVSEQRA